MKVRISAYLEELEDQKEENLANKNMLHADWIIKEAFSFCSVVEEMIVKDDKIFILYGHPDDVIVGLESEWSILSADLK